MVQPDKRFRQVPVGPPKAEPATQKPQPEPPKAPPAQKDEVGGPTGPEPTRYGDWERNGRCTDF
jgi:hypothetical protein